MAACLDPLQSLWLSAAESAFLLFDKEDPSWTSPSRLQRSCSCWVFYPPWMHSLQSTDIKLEGAAPHARFCDCYSSYSRGSDCRGCLLVQRQIFRCDEKRAECHQLSSAPLAPNSINGLASAVLVGLRTILLKQFGCSLSWRSYAASATTRLRPSRLARYSAWSARLRMLAAVSSAASSVAIPIEIVTSIDPAP